MGRRSDIKPLPSLERLNELLSYDEHTGILTWKMLPATSRSNIGFNNKCGGKIAGTVGAKGYIVVGIEKKYYLAHRIIWKLMTGADPIDIVDHEDTGRGNNRWLNLREAANGPNIQNGVSVRLGRFASIEEAASVIASARMRDHAEFARMA